MKYVIVILYCVICCSCTKTVTYYDSGQLKEKYSLNRNGKKVGKYRSYHKNGGLKTKGRYYRGLQQGKWLSYTQGGFQYRKIHVKAGEVVKIETSCSSYRWFSWSFNTSNFWAKCIHSKRWQWVAKGNREIKKVFSVSILTNSAAEKHRLRRWAL